MTDMTIDAFCGELLRDECPGARLEPERLAADFTRRFQVPLRVSLDDLAVLLENAGIGPISGARLEDGLRGVHYSLPDGGYAIQYEERQWEGGKVHTVLHETCEIIHEQVWDRHSDSKPSREICPEADRFAAAVMMPPETFAACAQASGLEVLALQRLFRCAYLSVTRRLGEVMRHQPLLAVLYERRGRNRETWPERPSPGELRATAVVRTPGFGARSSPLISGSRGRLPLPGRPPSPGSLAERATITNMTEYAEDEPGGNRRGGGLAVAVRPVLWHGQLAKISLVAVPYEDRLFLAPQFHRAALDPRELTAGARPATAPP